MTSRQLGRAPAWPLAAALSLCLAPAGSGLAADLDVREIVLENGMKVLLVPRAGDATVACGWVAKVGSVNERPGETGVAHLFEHLMFKGTKVVGTKDWKAESAILEEMDEVRGEIRREEEALLRKQYLGQIASATDPAVRTQRHQELLARYQELVAEQAKLVVDNEFDRIFKEAGATFLNAGTSHDATTYFVNVPANKLELWFWMESDRLVNPVFRQFYSERDVVWEERRLRTDSTPTGRLDEQFDAMFWQASPYSWPVIGWPTDLDGVSREEAMAFFDRNYSPNNLTAVLVGGFDAAEAERLARLYFGRLVRSPLPPSQVRTMEPEQLASKRLEGEADTSPTVTIRWHGVPFGHVDHPALQVLAEILSGASGRLDRALVQQSKIATSAGASADFRRYGGAFEVQGVAAPGHEPEEVEQALHAELRKLAADAVPERELQKVKNQSVASRERQLGSNFFLMFTLLYLDTVGEWRDVNTYTDRILAVTAEDVKRVANKYLTPQGRNVAVYRTKASDAARDPGFDALSPQQQQVARQIKAQVDGADLAKLEAGLARMEAAAASAPAEMRPVFEWAQRYVKSRLESLKGGTK